MTEKNISKQLNISVFVKAKPETILMDRRVGRRGLTFGTVEAVAKQYGVNLKVDGNGCLITGTKNSIQKVVEKLHFATVKFNQL